MIIEKVKRYPNCTGDLKTGCAVVFEVETEMRDVEDYETGEVYRSRILNKILAALGIIPKATQREFETSRKYLRWQSSCVHHSAIADDADRLAAVMAESTEWRPLTCPCVLIMRGDRWEFVRFTQVCSDHALIADEAERFAVFWEDHCRASQKAEV